MGPKTLTPTSVCGLPRYLKYIPVSRPTQLTASAKAINRNQPATVLPLRWTSDVVVMAAIVPEVAASYYRASLTVLPRSGAAQHQGVALSACSAQRRDRVARTPSGQFEGGVQGDAGTRHSDRVADRDGAAVDVDLVTVDAEFLGGGQRDRRECLVDLDDVELVDGDAFLGDGLLDGVGGLALQR